MAVKRPPVARGAGAPPWARLGRFFGVAASNPARPAVPAMRLGRFFGAAASHPARPSVPGMRLGRAAILVYFVAFAGAYALLVPPFEAPDEPAHLAYVNFVATRAALPNQSDPAQALAGHGPSPTEGHQPPLYYALGALVVRPFSPGGCASAVPAPNPAHAWNGGTREDVPLFAPAGGGALRGPRDRACFYALRGVSVALGALNVATVLALARHFFVGRWHVVPAALVATLPQFQFMSGVVSNDGLANLSIALCLLLAFRVLDDPARRSTSLLLGGALGLALLAKKTSLFVLPVLAPLAAYVAYRHPAARRRTAALAAAALGAALLVGGWWFVRSYVLYRDPLATEMEKATLGGLVQQKSLFSEYFRGPFRREFTRSFVGTFGWMRVWLPGAVYAWYALLAAAGAVGLALWTRSPRFPAAKVVLACGFVLTCFAGIVAYNLTYSQPQGRFLFPVLPLLAVLLAGGLRALLARVPAPRAAPALVACTLAALVLADAAALATLVGFYAQPPPVG